MTLETDFVAALLDYDPLTDVIGKRLYAKRPPENPTLPYVTWRRISTPRIQVLDGSVVASMPRFQFDVWAKDEAVGIPLTNTLQTGLLTLWGQKEVDLLDEGDYDEPVTLLFHRRVDVRFVHVGL
jgi:hypothetical protein